MLHRTRNPSGEVPRLFHLMSRCKFSPVYVVPLTASVGERVHIRKTRTVAWSRDATCRRQNKTLNMQEVSIIGACNGFGTSMAQTRELVPMSEA